uniref:B30.2/SPRY domain-containing protein n=1 Tax=Rhabditophanes sp. KR3021 TaxID=114890 RepID=A0AC35UI58_9BILA
MAKGESMEQQRHVVDNSSEVDFFTGESSIFGLNSFEPVLRNRSNALDLARDQKNLLKRVKLSIANSKIKSPAFPGNHDMLYHDDTMPSSRLEQLMLQGKPNRATIEQHAWNPEDRSLNIYVKEDDPLTLHRQPVAQSTDCIRGKVGYSKGFHVWKIVWPLRQRGTNAVIGVGNSDTQLHSLGYNSLIGWSEDSYGFDIVKLKCFHNAKQSEGWAFPNQINEGEEEIDKSSIPESIYCILDMDEGYMAFATDEKYLGVAFKGLKGQVLYPIVSAVWGHCEISITYMGGLQPEPPRLLAICRKTVRQHIGKRNIYKVLKLPIPINLTNFLQFK